MKRKNPQTSKDAYQSIKPAQSFYYDKILEGMRKLKVGGQFEEIALAAGITPAQCWKRLDELVKMGKIYNVGITRKTSSGRSAMVRQLVEFKEPTQTPESIINNAFNGEGVQQNLFP